MRLIVLYFIFYVTCIYSQKETVNWFLGNKIWLKFTDTISFETGSKLVSFESTTSYSDVYGKLVIYTDGVNVYDSKHNAILTDLNGDPSSSQGVIVVKSKYYDSIYYVFTSDYQGNNKGFCYTKIIKDKDSLIVKEKNIKLVDNVLEPISITQHYNKLDYWIVCHSKTGNNFFSFLLSKSGISNCPIITSIGFIYNGSPIGCQSVSNFSPNGKQFAISSILNDKCMLLQFDNKKGIFSNFIEINNINIPTGLIFSNSNKFLYILERDYNLIQYDILNNQKNIVYLNNNSSDFAVGIQRSINNKLYVNYINSNFIGVVENIDSNLTKVNFNRNGINLINKYTTNGLPNFNQSYFYTPSINYSYEMDCINNSIQFEGYDTIGAVTHQWQTKKLYSVNNYTSIGNTKNATHLFADTGTYIVRYIADNSNRKDTVEKTITLYPKIKKDFLGKDTTISQGSVFNIQLNSPQPSHCQEWYFERLNTQINKGSTNNIVADSLGKYICKTTNQAFCEVIDTLIINECINNLTMPSIYRNLTDTLFTYQQLADSFVWYKNNQQMAITKQPYIKVKDTGTYRVEAAKKGHCNRSSNTFYINKLGVKHYTLNDFNIKVYPNPSNGIINIESDKNYKLKVTDLIGKTILETENQKQIELVKGVYYLRFEINGYVVTEKVIVL